MQSISSIAFQRMNSLALICSISISRTRHRTRGDGVPSARHNNVKGVPARMENKGGFGRKSIIRGGTKNIQLDTNDDDEHYLELSRKFVWSFSVQY